MKPITLGEAIELLERCGDKGAIGLDDPVDQVWLRAITALAQRIERIENNEAKAITIKGPVT